MILSITSESCMFLAVSSSKGMTPARDQNKKHVLNSHSKAIKETPLSRTSRLAERESTSPQAQLGRVSALRQSEPDCEQGLGLDPEAVLDNRVCLPLFWPILTISGLPIG